MAKEAYKFNPKTLHYERVDRGIKAFLRRIMPYAIGSLIMGAFLLMLFLQIFDTPTEQKLRSENQFLIENLSEINSQLHVFNKELDEITERDNQIYRTIYQLDSIPGKVRNSGFGGANKYADLKSHNTSSLVIDVSRRLDKLNKKLNVQDRSYAELFSLIKNESERFASLPIIQPIHNSNLTRIGSYYGVRLHPILKIYKKHEGIDLTAPSGTPIYATGNGKVVRVEHNRSRRGYGNLVVIDHGVDGLSTRYAHMKNIKVRPGQKVKRGDIIGAVGNTGLSTAPHLHYEIRVNENTINPLHYYINVQPDEYAQMVQLAKKPGKSFD